MIAVDSSSWIAFLAGEPGSDVEAVRVALEQKQAVLPPVVLTELLSDSALPAAAAAAIQALPCLEVTGGYWERTGLLRGKLLARGRKARLADALIAQSCLDHNLALITRDSDFRNFQAAGLRVLPALPR